jgi:hypothetical protein
VIEHAHAGKVERHIQTGADVQQGNVGRDIGDAEHGDEEDSFVLAVAVFAAESFGGGMRDDGGIAKLDAGVANFAVEILEDGGGFLIAGVLAGDEPGNDGFEVGGGNLLVDDLAVFLGDLLPGVACRKGDIRISGNVAG